MRRAGWIGLLLLLASAAADGQWTLRYLYDEDKSSLHLTAIVFPTRTRGLATGELVEEGGRKPVVLLTSDGGAQWTMLRAPDLGNSLFCLEETACWMAGRRGVWFSAEAGRDWRRIFDQQGILRLHFLSRERGFAVGARKALYETRDGGKHWQPMSVAAEVKTNAARTEFSAICFSGRNGIIAGRSSPPEISRIPLWMDDRIEERKEKPSLSVVLETRDGGDTWTPATSSLFGRISQIQTNAGGQALALVEFDRWFSYPSEVYRVDLASGGNHRVLRAADLAVTDIALTPAGRAFAAGFEPPGKLARLPVPGKLRVLGSDDLTAWSEMEVDYRAVARRAMLAVAGGEDLWLATDTGMILKLEAGAAPGH